MKQGSTSVEVHLMESEEW